jgi:hypothetical protein
VRSRSGPEHRGVLRHLPGAGALAPLLKGNRLGVATLPGGEAVVVTDLCQQSGFSSSNLAEETREKLKPIFPPWEISGNLLTLGRRFSSTIPKKCTGSSLKLWWKTQMSTALIQLPQGVRHSPGFLRNLRPGPAG